jgi:endogenous inhibitor of DNA gyrase (YacG/DUF329 family)
MSISPRSKCPLCKRPAVAAHAPFCSDVCRDRDLLNWLGEAYAVPGPPAGATDEAGGIGETPLDKD